ncbi:hypothetical protein [Ideonella sp. BN130291]|uniref:hypothetical protein n=1 Tax=Ideonella sp. BN130291 TaxID=3112940 RepID=UPI002E26CFAB|nr:hypothetical protein [Ideonella sp. BN130291]
MNATTALLTLALAMPAAWAQTGTASNDPNAMPQGPVGTARADRQSDQQAAYERARADCRKEPRRTRRNCIVEAQKDYDREQTGGPALNLSRPALTPQ